MGIKGLNRYLKKVCSQNSIKKITIHEMKNKTIVIDSSIFIYRFLEKDKLMECMFRMATSFLQNDITPIYIFDSKPEEQKKNLVIKRTEKRKQAYMKYTELQKCMDNNTHTEEEEKDIQKQLRKWKIQSTRVTMEHLRQTKEILQCMGIEYYEALYEADGLCANFIRSKKAWACMSDDMDMLAYGCDFIIREWNIYTQEGTLYNTDSICNDIGIKNKDLCSTLVLMGNDYGSSRVPIDTVLQWYITYSENNSTNGFYQWLVEKELITDENREKLQTVVNKYSEVENVERKKKRKPDYHQLKNVCNQYYILI